MSKPLNIAIIGTGNVAHHIAASFTAQPNIKLVQVFNHRNTKQAKDFSVQYKAPLVSTYGRLTTQADVYIVCVKDSVLAEVAAELAALRLKGIVMHTSGSMDLDVLKKVSKQIGVYYPLQSFTKNLPVDWKQTPLLIESNSAAALKIITGIASSVSGTVKVVDSQTRLRLHLSAVFACNFTNALYAAAFDYIEEHLTAKDTELLRPIMTQAFRKIHMVNPKQAQTGPAMRNDKVVMDKHLALLKTDKQLTEVYQLLSALIIKQQTPG